MAHIIVIGGSAGALRSIAKLVKTFPKNFQASVFVVIHIAPTAESLLAQILSRSGKLPAIQPNGYTRIEKGSIYVAVPDKHLIIHDGHVGSSSTPHENRFRPSIDTLFRSAAENYGKQVVGVLVSGYMDDGVSGLSSIRKYGGVTIVQDPAEAQAPDLPLNGIRAGVADYVLPIRDIAAKLISLIDEEKGRTLSDMHINVKTGDSLDVLGERSIWTCPECGGLLWKIDENQFSRYECHIGHRFSQLSLLESKNEQIETALSTALRILKEKALLTKNMAETVEKYEKPAAAGRFREQANKIDKAIEVLGDLLQVDENLQT